VSAAEVVAAWHAALNAGDVDRLAGLSAEDVEVGGPRGSGRGAELVREWFGRANIRLEVVRTELRGRSVLVEQCASWGEGEPQIVASTFLVRDGRVASVIRHSAT
jgi:hypothetical protein